MSRNAAATGILIRRTKAADRFLYVLSAEDIRLKTGNVVNMDAGGTHWHGAAKNSRFSHLKMEVPEEEGSSGWCEPLEDEEYNKLK